MRIGGWKGALVLVLVLAGSGLVATGCAGIGGPPAWVNGETPPEYPRERYVTALATGENLAAARTAAKGELSRIFSARLASEIRLVDEESVEGGVVDTRSELLDRTTIATDLELQGVEVPLHWRDPRSGEVWALAVLDRNGECLRLRSEGRDLVRELEGHIERSRGTGNPLAAIRASLHAVDVSGRLDALQARSRVLGLQCLPPRPASTGDLRRELASRLAGLSFVVRASEVDARSGEPLGPLPQLREQIAGNLSRLGFQVGPAAGARVVPIEARLRLRRVERGTDWVEYRYEGSAEIGSPVAGQPAMIVVETEGAESHPEPSSARLRARRSGETALARQLDERLRAFLEETGEEAGGV